MPTINIDKTIQAWSNLNDMLFVPHTEAEYQKLVSLLDDSIDEVGEDESHPLASLMEVISLLIESYEFKNVPELD
jgi:HTH-type transcriptional regulator / antitoxin HigA